jgi:microcystin degradation protein MlrC
LGQLLETDKKNILAIINDPEAAISCHKKNIGDNINLLIGAKVDSFHGNPISINAKIEFISDGKFELENKNSHLASMMGDQIDMGLSAVIKNEKVRILLTSIKTPPMDLGQLYSQGIDPKDANFIIIKAAVSHKDAYDPIASYSFYIDSKGLCTSNLKRLPYKKIQHKKISLI